MVHSPVSQGTGGWLGHRRIIDEKNWFPTKIWWKPTEKAMAPAVKRTSDKQMAGAMVAKLRGRQDVRPSHPSKFRGKVGTMVLGYATYERDEILNKIATTFHIALAASRQ